MGVLVVLGRPVAVSFGRVDASIRDGTGRSKRPRTCKQERGFKTLDGITKAADLVQRILKIFCLFCLISRYGSRSNHLQTSCWRACVL